MGQLTKRIRKAAINNTLLVYPSHPLGIWGAKPLSRATNIAYVGWLSDGNFGDDIIARIARGLMPEAWLIDSYPRLRLEDRLFLSFKKGAQIDAILIGGGTLIGGNYTEAISRLREKDAPVFSFGTGVLEEELWPSNNLLNGWRDVIHSAECISVRGHYSERRLRKYFGYDRGIVVGDFALRAGSSIEALPCFVPQKKLRVGINLGTHLHAKNRKRRDLTLQAVAAVMRKLSNIADFVPINMHWLDCAETARAFESAGVPYVNKIALHKDPNQISEISKLDFVISERLHAGILSHSFAIPVLGFAYASKVLDHFDVMGQADCVVTSAELEAGALLSKCESLISRLPERAKNIAIRRNELIAAQDSYLTLMAQRI